MDVFKAMETTDRLILLCAKRANGVAKWAATPLEGADFRHLAWYTSPAEAVAPHVPDAVVATSGPIEIGNQFMIDRIMYQVEHTGVHWRAEWFPANKSSENGWLQRPVFQF